MITYSFPNEMRVLNVLTASVKTIDKVTNHNDHGKLCFDTELVCPFPELLTEVARDVDADEDGRYCWRSDEICSTFFDFYERQTGIVLAHNFVEDCYEGQPNLNISELETLIGDFFKVVASGEIQFDIDPDYEFNAEERNQYQLECRQLLSEPAFQGMFTRDVKARLIYGTNESVYWVWHHIGGCSKFGQLEILDSVVKDGRQTITFMTVKDMPFEVIDTLANQNPGDCIRFEYAGEYVGHFCGLCEWENGKYLGGRCIENEQKNRNPVDDLIDKQVQLWYGVSLMEYQVNKPLKTIY